jgi:tRNA(Ile)-lysidine synthase
MENLIASFQDSLDRLGVTKKDRLLLAVSGGLDSVVLAECTARSGLNFGIAHANFQLRGPESDRDESFVRRLANQYNRPFFTKKFETTFYAETEKVSIQVAARDLRYAWFKTMTGNDPSLFQYLLTAHHQDDQVETMVMHFFRGTGIQGLTGMPEKNGVLLRPFLFFPKSLLKEFAVTQNLSWVEDSTNASGDYTRNYFRNQLIPAVATIFPDVQQNLEKNLHRFSEGAALYRQAVALHKKKLLKPVGLEFHIPILLLKKAVPQRTILFEIIKDYHFTAAQTEEVIRLMDSSNGKYISGPSHRIIKNRRWLIIAPLATKEVSHIIVEKNDRTIEYPQGHLRIKHIANQEQETISKEADTACLDAEKIRFPLILRKWEAGDYFYPLGMKKKKKLARFFIDQKISKTAKEKIWVLVMDSQIVWVVGKRIDNRFRIGPSTSKMMLISSEGMPLHPA